ncbi:MAG: phosphonopyruvate decarboxylase [Fidelibacterota bacterium]|nr:MAG: phosphonopyruvate decarboxylase [Candidatus Neomarinimicrobiota bacterium]
MQADWFHHQLVEQEFGPFTGVPCSLVKELIIQIEQSEESSYVIATSEGEAMGLAGGFALAGRLPVVIMQNDGLGNAINPLSSLQLLYDLPALLIITWRAEPGTKPDAPQHRIMGETLPELLELMKIPYAVLEDDELECKRTIAAAKEYLSQQKRPFALIIRRDLFQAEKRSDRGPDPELPLRIDYIKALAGRIDAKDIILGTTGYTGRELKQVINRPGTFYTAGSMGCIGSIGLALAREQPDRKVYVLDGDGALLMKLGTLATIGLYRPANLIHIVFDNGQYESTGGQQTASGTISFPAVGEHSGYAYATSVESLAEFEQFLEQAENRSGPLMCHVRVQPGTLPDLQRPSQSPEQLRHEFQQFLDAKC